MGLDMYLNRYPKVEGHQLWKLDPDRLEKKNPALRAELKQYERRHGTEGMFTWNDYGEEVGYWRKVNAVHDWFVQNVQRGRDECDPYIVREGMLKKLLQTCTEVFLAHTEEKAKELLPTTEGFFFGGTDYGDWYWQGVSDTIRIVTKVLAETDFDKEVIVYQSSW